MENEPERPTRPWGPRARSLKERIARDRARPGLALGGTHHTEATRGGRHRAPTRGSGRLLRLVAFVLIPALVLLLSAYALFKPGRGMSPATAACADQRVPLTITASPALAPVLTKAAAAFDQGTASLVDGRCTRTTVVSAEMEAFGDTLRTALEAGGGSSAPTAWVPDSSLSREVLARRPELSAALPRSFPVIAVSPAVIAAPKPMAEALGWPDEQPSWQELLDLARDPAGWAKHGHPEWGRVKLAWQDPLKDAASLTTMVSLSDWALGDASSVDDVRRSLLGAHSALSGLNVDRTKALAPLRDAKSTDEALQKAVLVPATERDVTTFNATSPRVPLAALYPTDGVFPNEVPLIAVDAPWVTPQQRAALDRLAVFLVTGEAAAQFADAGWRTPRLTTEVDVTDGAIASEPRYSPAGPSAWGLARSLQGWTALDRQGSVLVLLDTSGSMNERVAAAGNATRLELAKQAISASLPLFSDRTNVGLWTFSRHDDRTDFTVVLGLGPLSRTVAGRPAMQVLQTSIAGLRADGATGLYDTVIAAASEAQRGWRQGDNTIILISDGKNEDPGSASIEQVLAKLKPLAGPERPVRLLSIALGDAADAAALRKLADATDGDAYLARKAEDLDKVFLAALTE